MRQLIGSSFILISLLTHHFPIVLSRELPSLCQTNPEKWFICASGKSACVNKLATCNGNKDCPDGSDEASCACIKNKDCPGGQRCHKFPEESKSECSSCPKGKRFVNGKCQDENECDFKYKNVCQKRGTCVNLDGSYTCVNCPSGYQARMVDERLFHERNRTTESEDNRLLYLCGDENECSAENVCGGRPNSCVNSIGGHSCECPPNHVKGNHENVCRAIGEQPQMVIAEDFAVSLIDLHSAIFYGNFREDKRIIDIVSMDDVVYFANSRQIWEFRVATKRKDLIADLDLSKNKSMGNGSSIRQLGVDWIRKRILYLAGDTLSAVDLHGRSLTVMRKRRIDSFAFDAIDNYVFYSNAGRVMRVDFQSDPPRETGYFTAIKENPSDEGSLSIDPHLKMVYFIHNRILYSFDYDGKKRLIMSTSATFGKLEPFEDRIFATYSSEMRDSSGLISLGRTGYTVGASNASENFLSFSEYRPRSVTILQSSKFPQTTAVDECSHCQSKWCYLNDPDVDGDGRCSCSSDGECPEVDLSRLKPLRNEIELDEKPNASLATKVPTLGFTKVILISLLLIGLSWF